MPLMRVHKAKCWLSIKGPFPSVLTESGWCRITPLHPPFPHVSLCCCSLHPPLSDSYQCASFICHQKFFFSPPCSRLDLFSLNQPQQGTNSPTQRANHSDMKGNGLRRKNTSQCICLCAVHICINTIWDCAHLGVCVFLF